MNLIKIEERDGVQFVNARELHETLCVGRDFPTWMAERIKKYDFIEGKDFSPKRGKVMEVDHLQSI